MNNKANPSREWLVRMADAEDQYESIAVGGLASAMGVLHPAPTTLAWVFGRLIEFARRARGRTVEQLAHEADVDLGELVALERASGVTPQPRTVYQLAGTLKLPVPRMMELAGLAEPRDPELGEAALRFAARSEPSAKLSKDEQKAFEEFVGAIAKASDGA